MLIKVVDPSQTGDARRKAIAFSEELRMSEAQSSAVALVATEMATNILKHAGAGYILLQEACENGHKGLRVMGVDKGPGISDISRALADGQSTAGSMGAGLGAIKRAADSFDLYSAPGAGTVISAEFWKEKNGSGDQLPVRVGVVSEPIAGEDESGDGFGVRAFADAVSVMVVDGLGHGILAAEAAREAERVLSEAKRDSICEIVQDAHDALKKTRGAAIGIAKIQPAKGLLSFAGIGNVSASIVASGSSRSMASHNGILGQQMQRLQEFTIPWNPDSILVMHSDGVATRWDLDRYPGIRGKSPSVIAAVLHRDYSRERDDATVLVAKAA